MNRQRLLISLSSAVLAPHSDQTENHETKNSLQKSESESEEDVEPRERTLGALCYPR